MKGGNTDVAKDHNDAEQAEEELLAELLEMAKPTVEERRRLGWVVIPFVLAAVAGFILIAHNRGAEWQPALELGGAILTVIGAIVIAYGGLPEDRTAARMSTTRLGGNSHLLAELQKNKITARWGLVFILLGFACQMAVLAMRLGD